MSDKKLLQQTILSAGLIGQAKHVWVVDPLLEDMAARLAAYVGPHTLSSNGEPLLQACLKEAFARYRAETEEHDNPKQAVARFAATLLAYGREVFAQRLTVDTPGGEYVWLPFVCAATEFEARFPGAVPRCVYVESELPESIATAFMLTKIVPHTLLNSAALMELFDGMKVS